MSNRLAATIVAMVVLGVGLAVGFWPHSVPNNTLYSSMGDTISCGSAFAKSGEVTGADAGAAYANAQSGGAAPLTDFQGACEDAVSGPRTAAWVLVGVGGVAMLFLILTAPRTTGRKAGQVPAQDTAGAPQA